MPNLAFARLSAAVAAPMLVVGILVTLLWVTPQDGGQPASQAGAYGFSGGPPTIDHPEPETLPTGSVAFDGVASRTGPAGLPLGFPHSTIGAVAAGTAWLTVIEGAGVLDSARRPVLLSSLGDTQVAAAVGDRIAARAEALGLPGDGQPPSGHVLAVARPEFGAYRLIEDGTSMVRIEVWYPYQLAVVADGAPPPRVRWFRAQVALRWDAARDDWQLASDITVADGPDPGETRPSFVARTAALAAFGPRWQLYADTQE
ncbi:hypothetical protein [Krasilnikovia sp. MM14-A1259]|uniref:hypothetical protein n=1 Tax=Krasilnikovia sp. MM14-A1259 TaxID=3373539 RepID=UPI003824FDAC